MELLGVLTLQIRPEFTTRKIDDQYGEFVVEPLPRGYGVTLGNPLRRILLSSIPGTAVTSVYIEDVLHEFSVIDGIKEDVMQIILSLKELVVKLPDDEPVTLTLRKEKEGIVTAADLVATLGVEIVNPDLHIATLSKDAALVMEIRVEKNKGYVPAEIHATKDRINSIPVDAVFTPVKRVEYRIEDTRVGQETDLDRLILRIWTNGSTTPREALNQAVEILQSQLRVFAAPSVEDKQPEIEEDVLEQEQEEEAAAPAESTEVNLESLELSSRVLHSLQEEGIDSIDALLALSEKDLKKVGGVGEKSLEEIKSRLAKYNLVLKSS